MKRSYKKMIFAASIVILFLLSSGVCGIQNPSQQDERGPVYQDNNSANNDAVITCFVDGKPNSQTVSYDSGVYLKELFSELAVVNAHNSNSQKSQDLQWQILSYAEQQGLLPRGMSADVFLAQLRKQGLILTAKSFGGGVFPLGVGREMFCNFVATGEGSAFPIIILPRFIPFIMAPIPRLFVGWKTPMGITSCGGLVSGTGFYAVGPQQGFALGFWGIGFSIFLPPVMAYGMFGYALFAKATAEYMEFYPPNNPPGISAVYPLDGAGYVPLSTSELRFSLSDYDGDLMSYSVTTFPDVGGGNGNLKPDGTYTVSVSGLKSATKYTWYVSASDGMDTVEEEYSFTTEAVAPVVSDERPMDGDRYVPETQASLSFHLRDPQNDLMSYTVETIPDIGSGSGSGVGEGNIIVSITGLELMTEYRWFVNVTDGENPVSEEFWFRTGPVMVFDPFAEGWIYRKMITIDHMMVAGDLEHFPVLLSFIDSDLRDKAQDDGDDILFMDGAGVATRLYHEIEEFDGSSGRLVAWVNVSSLSSTVDTVFYLYYGNVGSADQQCPEKVWDAGFVLVQHFNERSGMLFDSTMFSNDGVPYGGVSQDVVGKIGNADGFDGSNDYVEIVNSPSLNPMGSISLEAWYKPESFRGTGSDPIIDKGYDPYSESPHYQYHLAVVGDQYPVKQAEFEFYIANSAFQNVLTGVDFWIPNTWYHIIGTYDGTTEKLYANGILLDSKQITSVMADFGENLRIASFTNRNYYLPGTIDEVRISSSARSADWILTEYQNQNNPSGFFGVGPEEQ